MTEMLERVAAAIGAVTSPAGKCDTPGPVEWDQARAALVAMLNPTADMLDALGPEGIRADPDIVRGVYADIWRKMNRTALGERP